jgi:hypothetical protein
MTADVMDEGSIQEIRFPTNQPPEFERPSSPDINLGAYLVSHLRTVCENCGVTETPQWRRGYWSSVLNTYTMLCNKCGLKYHKSQFCPYCHFVYGKEMEKDPKIWLTCNSCGRWVHIECEFQRGGDSSIGVYKCPDCRTASATSRHLHF